MVEDILKHVATYKNKAIYQEALTLTLARHYKAKVILIGIHQGIKIRSEAE